MTTVLISSELSPLLGCRGSSREKKTTEGLIPSPFGPASAASLTIVHRHISGTEQNCRAKGLEWEGGMKKKKGSVEGF